MDANRKKKAICLYKVFHQRSYNKKSLIIKRLHFQLSSFHFSYIHTCSNTLLFSLSFVTIIDLVNCQFAYILVKYDTFQSLLILITIL